MIHSINDIRMDFSGLRVERSKTANWKSDDVYVTIEEIHINCNDKDVLSSFIKALSKDKNLKAFKIDIIDSFNATLKNVENMNNIKALLSFISDWNSTCFNKAVSLNIDRDILLKDTNLWRYFNNEIKSTIVLNAYVWIMKRLAKDNDIRLYISNIDSRLNTSFEVDEFILMKLK